MFIRDEVAKTILIVEDDVDLGQLIITQSRQNGYKPYIVTSVTEAIRVLEEHSVHCVVLDLSLVKSPYVLDGIQVLEFLQSQAKRVPVVILTSYATGKNITRIYQDFKGLIARVISKLAPEYPADLQTAISRAVDPESGVNWNLQLVPRDGLSIDLMISQLQGISVESSELIELIGRAFSRPLKVDLLPLTPGFSGAGVVKAVPHIKAGRDRPVLGEMVVFKYGKRSKIQQEVNNFRTYVEPFSKGHQRTSLVAEPVYTHRLGALQYTLIGAQEEHFMSFGEFYERTHEIEQLERTLDNLFGYTCANWYGERDKEFIVPYEAYRGEYLATRVREWAERYAPELLDSPVVEFPELDRMFRNPLMLMTELGKSSRQAFQSVVHGDLNGNNILVDSSKAETWLIDFYHTGIGHLMNDFSKLETIVKFELVDNANIPVLHTVELCLLEPNRLDEPIAHPAGQLPADVEKMISVLSILRRHAAQVTWPLSDTVQYSLALFYRTVLTLTFEELVPAKRKHVLLSLCLLGEFLHEARA
jgi:CheY-like chemotaxis protein